MKEIKALSTQYYFQIWQNRLKACWMSLCNKYCAGYTN